ncbi:MAG: LpqB family beta-propeller domain-containing protein, partial [Lapillicoccus sp.]
WLTGRTIVQVAPSPDGTRLAVLSRTGVGRDDRLDIAGIVRDAAGSPTVLATPYRQGQPLLGFLDVTWVNPLTLAVLARDLPGDALRPFLVSIGKGVGLRRVGQLSREQLLIPEVLNARSITSKGSESSLIVMTSTGAELRVGPTWSAVGEAREIIVAAS